MTLGQICTAANATIVKDVLEAQQHALEEKGDTSDRPGAMIVTTLGAMDDSGISYGNILPVMVSAECRQAAFMPNWRDLITEALTDQVSDFGA